MSSTTGLEILFSFIAKRISKGDGENMFIRTIKFIIKKHEKNKYEYDNLCLVDFLWTKSLDKPTKNRARALL
jgi:hypothetical protein